MRHFATILEPRSSRTYCFHCLGCVSRCCKRIWLVDSLVLVRSKMDAFSCPSIPLPHAHTHAERANSHFSMINGQQKRSRNRDHQPISARELARKSVVKGLSPFRSAGVAANLRACACMQGGSSVREAQNELSEVERERHQAVIRPAMGWINGSMFAKLGQLSGHCSLFNRRLPVNTRPEASTSIVFKSTHHEGSARTKSKVCSRTTLPEVFQSLYSSPGRGSRLPPFDPRSLHSSTRQVFW